MPSPISASVADRASTLQFISIANMASGQNGEGLMADGGWIVLSAAVGAAGSIVTSWMNAWFSRGRPDYFDKIAIKILKRELEDGTEHSLRELSNLIGLHDKETRELLLISGATGNKNDSTRWAIRSVGHKAAERK